MAFFPAVNTNKTKQNNKKITKKKKKQQQKTTYTDKHQNKKTKTLYNYKTI